MSASAVWTRTNRYNVKVHKKRYIKFLIVLFTIPYFFQGRQMIHLIDKTKNFSEKRFTTNFWIFK